MFRLIYSRTAARSLKKLDKDTKERILSALERCRIRPFAHVQKLIGGPYFRLRVGDYRIITRIDKGNLIILVIKIGHRKKVYKKL